MLIGIIVIGVLIYMIVVYLKEVNYSNEKISNNGGMKITHLNIYEYFLSRRYTLKAENASQLVFDNWEESSTVVMTRVLNKLSFNMVKNINGINYEVIVHCPLTSRPDAILDKLDYLIDQKAFFRK